MWSYDPSVDAWYFVGKIGIPYGASVIWTGNELLIYGGFWERLPPGRPMREMRVEVRGDLRAYDPTNDVMTILPGGVQRTRHAAVWTGTSMIVWGGQSREVSNRLGPWLQTGAIVTPTC